VRELITAPAHDRKRSLGWLAVEWIERWCRHGPGDVQGDPVRLDDEFAGFVVDCYALDEHGRRLYDSAFLSRAKGRAKSELAGFLVLFEALGPARFAGWAQGGETYKWRGWESEPCAPGEPLGRVVQAPFIRCLATEEQQAGNTYDNVYFNLKEAELGENLPGDAAGLTRTFLPGGGEIRPSTSGNASKDGGKETFVVVDESHLLVLPEHQRMVATVRRNLGKRKASEPWSLETSTMYAPGEDSVAEQSHAYASQIAEGKVRAARLLWDHREAPADVDMGDPVQLEAALREVYGDFAGVMDLERIMHEIWDPRSDPSDSRRFWLNQRTSSADSWLTQPEWAGCADAAKVVADRELVTLGFDGSRSRARGVTDATALIGCRVSDGHLFEVAVWEQPQGAAGNGWQVPTTEVDAAVRTAFGRWDVCALYCDPAKWETWVAAWERDFGSQLRVKASRDHPCEWWMSSGRSGAVVRALEQMHSAVVDRELSHDGSFALTRHVLNARRHPTRSGLQIRKEHPDSQRKIDAAVAAVLAWQARLDAVAAGVGQRRPSFVPRRLM